MSSSPLGQWLPHKAIYQNNPDFIRTLTELHLDRIKPDESKAKKNLTQKWDPYLKNTWWRHDNHDPEKAQKKKWRDRTRTKPKTTKAQTKTIMDETTKNKENKKITRPYTWTQIEHSKKRRERHDEKDTKGKKREHMTLKKQKPQCQNNKTK